MKNRKIIAAVGMTAALAGGGLAGATLGNPLASGAQDGTTTTEQPAEATTDTPSRTEGPRHGRGPGRFDGGAAAEALGLTTKELRTELKAGKTLAEVAEAQGVDKQDLIDALVAAGETRLDEAKAELPDRIAELVDSTLPARGEGGHGGRGEPGGRGGPGERPEGN